MGFVVDYTTDHAAKDKAKQDKASTPTASHRSSLVSPTGS
jgi:hypothetical protein